MVTTEKRNMIRVVTSNAKPHGRSVAWLDIFMAVIPIPIFDSSMLTLSSLVGSNTLAFGSCISLAHRLNVIRSLTRSV